MIIQQTKEFDVQSTVSGKKVEMGIDLAAMPHMYDKPSLAYLDPARVDDPDLAEYAKMADKDLTDVLSKRMIYQSALAINNDLRDVEAPKDPTKQYPLFNAEIVRRCDSVTADHMYAYLNAAYALRQDGKL